MKFRKSTSAEDAEEDPASVEKRRGLRGFVNRVLRKNVTLENVEPSGLPKTDMFLAEESSNSDAGNTESESEPEQNGELFPGGILSHVVIEPESVYTPSPEMKQDDTERTDKRFPSPEIGDDSSILDKLAVVPVGTQAVGTQHTQSKTNKVSPSDAAAEAKELSDAEESCGSVQDSRDEVTLDDNSYDDVIIPKRPRRHPDSPEITVGDAPSIDSTFYDPADDIVRDLHQAGTDFVSAFARIFSIFRVKAKNVEDEQKFDETTKPDKTFAEVLEECMAGVLINCSPSNNKSCHPQHVDRTTILQTDQLVLPPIKEEKAIVSSTSPPLFFLPQEPTETYQWEAKQGLEDLADATDGSSSVESKSPDLDAKPVVERVKSSVTCVEDEGDNLNVLVHRQTNSVPAGIFSAFSQPMHPTQKKGIGIARPVSVLSRNRSGSDDDDRILKERLRSAQSPFGEAEDIYRLRSDERRGEDIILPPAFRNSAESSCEEKRDSSVCEPPSILLPPSLSQLASSKAVGGETGEPDEFLLKCVGVEDKFLLEKSAAEERLETVERHAEYLFERKLSQASF